MKFCINCGKKIQDGTKFCPYCGAKQGPDVNKAINYGNTTQQNQLHQYSNHNRNYQNTNPQMSFMSPVIKKRIIPPKCSFIKAFKLFWKNYFNFSGYSSRSEFWWWFLIEYIIDMFVSAHVSATFKAAGISLFGDFTNGGGTMTTQSPMNAIISAVGISMVWYLILLIPNLSLRVRRFRDAGVSNGWIITILICDYIPWIIPIFGWLIAIVARITTLVFELMPSVRLVHTK